MNNWYDKALKSEENPREVYAATGFGMNFWNATNRPTKVEEERIIRDIKVAILRFIRENNLRFDPEIKVYSSYTGNQYSLNVEISSLLNAMDVLSYDMNKYHTLRERLKFIYSSKKELENKIKEVCGVVPIIIVKTPEIPSAKDERVKEEYELYENSVFIRELSFNKEFKKIDWGYTSDEELQKDKKSPLFEKPTNIISVTRMRYGWPMGDYKKFDWRFWSKATRYELDAFLIRYWPHRVFDKRLRVGYNSMEESDEQKELLRLLPAKITAQQLIRAMQFYKNN